MCCAEDNKAKLVEYGALEVLARCVCDDGTDLALQRVAIIGMFDLIYSSGMCSVFEKTAV
jgi:hypothetical protein